MTTTSWPHGDIVAEGVLNTVSDRRDVKREVLYTWAAKRGKGAFYAILADESGFVQEFCEWLATPGDDFDDEMDPDTYARYVGPAIDRIEDAYCTA
jgi:hypothetical protein